MDGAARGFDAIWPLDCRPNRARNLVVVALDHASNP